MRKVLAVVIISLAISRLVEEIVLYKQDLRPISKTPIYVGP